MSKSSAEISRAFFIQKNIDFWILFGFSLGLSLISYEMF